MAGLVPAIHVFAESQKGVDARDKPAHDEANVEKIFSGKVVERSDFWLPFTYSRNRMYLG